MSLSTSVTAPAARSRLVLAMVAVLPLHTVGVHAWIAWDPWLIVLVAVVTGDLVAGVRARTWPWDRSLSIAGAVFLSATAASWSGAAPDRFLRLLLALGAGVAVLLTVSGAVRRPGVFARVLRVVFWSGAVMGATALVVALLSVGTFGQNAIDVVNDLPLVDRVTKAAYLESGFIAVTNWHQDPGYAAAWMNLWAGLSALASLRGLGTRRRWVDGLVVGGLWFGVLMTLSRTGALGAVVSGAAIVWTQRARLADALRLLAWSAVTVVLLTALVWIADRPGVAGDLGDQISFRLDQAFSLGPGDGIGADGGPALDYRGVVWPYYVDAFRTHPLRGIGLGTGWAAQDVQEPHNLALQLAGETGMLGVLGFAALLGTILRKGRHPVGRAALVIALSAAFTQTVLFEPTWWFAAALACAPISDEAAPP